MNKTVLFISSRLPFPISSGRKNSLYHYCRIIHNELNCRLIVASFLENGDEDEIENVPQFIDRLVILDKPGYCEVIKNVFFDSMLKSKYPLQTALFYSNSNKKHLDMLIKEEKPDVVFGDMVRCAEYLKGVNAITVADLDDRISLRYKRQLEANTGNVNPYGALLERTPDYLKKLVMFRPVVSIVTCREIALLSKYETEIGRMCSATVFVARREAENFNRELNANKAVVVSIGVDVDYFFYRECGNNNEYLIGFLGALNVAHNENAVRHFITDIFPYILSKIPNARFMVIGGGASDELKKMASEHVLFCGRVADVRDYLEKCKVFVCPLLFGSGIKTKNLEAMAMGLPVVTTSMGAENIDALNGRDWIISDNDFAERVIELMTDAEMRRKMGKAASEFVLSNFMWERVTKQLYNLILKKNQTE